MQTRRRILVVDDSNSMPAFVVSILKEANYEDIGWVHDGISALALLRANKYDLVICDWQIQPISGLALTRLIKDDVRLRKVRVILIGSHGQDEALLNGADGYVGKPFEPRDLKEEVEDVLSAVAQLASG